MSDLTQKAETIIQRFGDKSIFNLTLNDFLTVTRAVVQDVPTDKTDRYYTRQDLMTIFRVSYPTLTEHCKKGLLTSTKKIGHKHLYSQADIDNYLSLTPKAPNCPL